MAVHTHLLIRPLHRSPVLMIFYWSYNISGLNSPIWYPTMRVKCGEIRRGKQNNQKITSGFNLPLSKVSYRNTLWMKRAWRPLQGEHRSTLNMEKPTHSWGPPAITQTQSFYGRNITELLTFYALGSLHLTFSRENKRNSIRTRNAQQISSPYKHLTA